MLVKWALLTQLSACIHLKICMNPNVYEQSTDDGFRDINVNFGTRPGVVNRMGKAINKQILIARRRASILLMMENLTSTGDGTWTLVPVHAMSQS